MPRCNDRLLALHWLIHPEDSLFIAVAFFAVWLPSLRLGEAALPAPVSRRIVLALMLLVFVVPFGFKRLSPQALRAAFEECTLNLRTLPVPGDLRAGDPRAQVFEWIRMNTGAADIILDPPMNRQFRVPSFGYNELLSWREHLLTAKEAHMYVYVKSALYPAMRDFETVYGIADPYLMFSGFMENHYRKIDDARLQLLTGMHPRLKYFVQENDAGVAISYPRVYANGQFTIYCLRCPSGEGRPEAAERLGPQ